MTKSDLAILGFALRSVMSHSLKKSNPAPISLPKEEIPTPPSVKLSPSAIPSSKISRFFQYTRLAAGVSAGSAVEILKRATGRSQNAQSLLFTPQNTQRIVDRLVTMRGAALKLGQMLSIQDNALFPKEIESIMASVQNAAHYMPEYQLQKVLTQELGSDWKSEFSEFEMVPVAAASIGQVHRAVLKTGEIVAVKVQYPGVAESIDSDLSYLRSLLSLSPLLPKGLYLDNTIRVAAKELGWECDYMREAQSTTQFRKLLRGRRGINVPRVFSHLSTSKVLTTEFVKGLPISNATFLSQESRNRIAERMFRLCMDELFVFRFMQTDPNWSNFLYQVDHDTVSIPNHTYTQMHLIDFGAARAYSKEFTDRYMHLLHAASLGDTQGCIHWSRELGFLTGYESHAMNDAHVSSLLLLAQPFSTHSRQPFSFASQTITDQVRSAIPTMLKERLTPPPDEAYSLHRKLSGCFLLCTKLGARFPAARIFKEYHQGYIFS